MGTRALVVTLVGLAALLSYTALTRHHSDHPTNLPLHRMAADPPPSTDSLVVELGQGAGNPLHIQVTVRNTHPTTALTILPWDTPLDGSAGPLGVFQLTDIESGKVLELPTIKVSRKLPISRDSLIQVDAGADVTKEIKVEMMKIGDLDTVERGKRYEVQARGQWRAVWPMSADQVGEDVLARDYTSGGAMKGTFESKKVTVESSP